MLGYRRAHDFERCRVLIQLLKSIHVAPGSDTDHPADGTILLSHHAQVSLAHIAEVVGVAIRVVETAVARDSIGSYSGRGQVIAQTILIARTVMVRHENDSRARTRRPHQLRA